jgi:hypothetical protein
MVKQAAFVPQRSDIRLRLLSLSAQIEAELAAALDFELVGTLGMQRKSVEKQSAQLPLSEEDYLTLPARHADLVQRVTNACRELMGARDYAALGPLSVKLKELKALDLSGIRGTGGEGQGGADDPVVVGVGAGAASSYQGFQDSGASEGDDGANDPVISSSCG